MKKFIIMVCIVLMWPIVAFANSTITTSWNPNNESDLAGYYVYKVTVNKGDTAGTYVLRKDGGTPSATVPAGTETVTFNNQPDGFYAIVVTAYDDADNESNAGTPEVIKRVDTTDPVITLNGDAAITLERGTAFTDPGAAATDNLDGDLTAAITTTGEVNINTVGDYTITYNVSDETPLTASIERTVSVVDNAPPDPPTGVEVIWAKIMAWLKCNILNKC